ncbi:MAG: hypothetical protein KDA68_09230 [Planctomycetaceae bacterium]|nr:hypothetical protein [Planctomycetaceae bacterium]
MRRLTLLALLVTFPLIVGCTTFPKGPFAKSPAKKKHSASKRTADAESDADPDADYEPIDKRLIVDDEEHDAFPSDAEIFEKSAPERPRIKESDGLSTIFKGLIDPRTTEINRNLGYE